MFATKTNGKYIYLSFVHWKVPFRKRIWVKKSFSLNLLYHTRFNPICFSNNSVKIFASRMIYVFFNMFLSPVQYIDIGCFPQISWSFLMRHLIWILNFHHNFPRRNSPITIHQEAISQQENSLIVKFPN